MTAAGNVIPLRGGRAATRLGPKEARLLAEAAVPRVSTTRQLLALFLRTCNPRHGYSKEFTEAYLAEELGVTDRTIRRAFRALEKAGLATVDPGDGRTWTRVTLQAEDLATICLAHGLRNPLVNYLSHPGEPPVHPGDSVAPEGGQFVRPRRTKRPPRGDNLPAPYVRAREKQPEVTDTPPPPREGAGRRRGCSTHGPGCRLRACAQSPRKAMSADARAAEQSQWKERTEADKAAAVQAPPELVEAVRSALHANKSTTPRKGNPK